MHGRETGQWHEADLAVAHWLQHTSRDGDMQLHVHSQIAHIARTGTDGKWRAPDSLGYNEHIGAVAAIVSQHLEEALTARFGLEWTARDDGHGFEIKGITGAMMRVFSSRRESITADLRGRAARFEQRYGRAPSQRELAHLAQASNFKTRATEGRRAGCRAAARGLGGQARAHPRRPAGVGRAVGLARPERPRGPAHARRGRRGAHRAGAGPRGAEGGRAGPAGKERLDPRGRDQVPGPRPAPHRHGIPAAAAALLEDLADRALASEFEPVTCLEAPEPAEVAGQLAARGRAQRLPAARRHPVRHARAAGHGRTHGRASRRGRRAARDPRAGRARARRGPGAARGRAGRTRARRARAQDTRDAQDTRTGSGLREDQAAAALAVLTDGRLVSVINAPAGSGKTRVLAEAARIWAGAGLGPVIGITPSQSARNTLAAGVPVSYNAAQFLGHLPGRRGARGPVPIGPGTLLVIDEASMLSGPDLADLIAYAKTRGAKIILAGDISQLQAVENGGGMSLLADALGYARLAEPVRFRQPGNSKPACGCATATPACWPSTTSTAGSSAATRSR